MSSRLFRSRHSASLLAALILSVSSAMAQPSDPSAQPAARSFAEREADWRNGPIVYQVIVDRFAPPADPDAKRDLYPAPKKLRAWEETPARGEYVKEVEVWSHEIDFWGGDLESLSGRLDYIRDLGADVLYLNPIHLAYTNHKYDALDYFAISPEYGNRQDFRHLAEAVHQQGMKLVVDGVFNHMGRGAPWFRDARDNPQSPWRDWFFAGDEWAPLGYRAWVNVPNLPELRLENANLRARLFLDADSVVQGYLRDGADGWRLDVAFDIGPMFLSELTQAAHQAKPGSVVIGEIWNYPAGWFPAVDGVMNFHARQAIFWLLDGKMSGARFGSLYAQMIDDAGLEPILRSWLVLDNHDTPRLAFMMADPWKRQMARALQLTLPGSPCLYYGSELGMTGGDDPENRAPMRWDLVSQDNEELAWMRRLIALRGESPALRAGDFALVGAEKMLAFLRRSGRAAETLLVLANPSEEPVTEVLQLRDPWLMNYSWMSDALGSGERVQILSGLILAQMPPRSIRVFRPEIEQGPGYTPYKRVP
jgi:cyclomaltodextrinase